MMYGEGVVSYSGPVAVEVRVTVAVGLRVTVGVWQLSIRTAAGPL